MTIQQTFATKEEKPSTEEYLKADLDEVLDRLNHNPSGLQSEGEFIQAAIQVRAAKANERHTKWMIILTAIIAIATTVLTIVPFLSPSFEAQQVSQEIAAIQDNIDTVSHELNAMQSNQRESNQSFQSLMEKIEQIEEKVNHIPRQRKGSPGHSGFGNSGN